MSLFSFGFSSSKRRAAETRSETESPSTDADCPAGQPSASAELKRPAAKKRTKVFQASWLSYPEFKSWLAYDETIGVMTCRFCLASNFDNNFTRGCRDLQRSAPQCKTHQPDHLQRSLQSSRWRRTTESERDCRAKHADVSRGSC